MAVFNTIQNFATLKLTRRLYAGVAPTSGKPLYLRTAHSPPHSHSYRTAGAHVRCVDIDLRRRAGIRRL